MSKKTQKNAAWNGEIAEHGLKAVIADRLQFHGGFYLGFVAAFCGCAITTAKKHLDRMVQEGSATKEFRGDDWHYRFLPKT